jgi:hypothetical protein
MRLTHCDTEMSYPYGDRIPEFAWMNWEKPRGTSFRIPDVPDDIRNTDIPIRLNEAIFTETFRLLKS